MDVSPTPRKRARPKRRQCRNCPKRFAPRTMGGSEQFFCSQGCRKEFHRNGAAFGVLRDKLPKFIEREVEKQFGGVMTVNRALKLLAAMRKEYRGQIEKLGTQVESLAQSNTSPPPANQKRCS